MRILRPLGISLTVIVISVAVVVAGVRLREARTSEPVAAASSPSPTTTFAASRAPAPIVTAVPSATTPPPSDPVPPLASPQQRTAPPTPPATPCPQPIPTASPDTRPAGVASVLRLPGSPNVRLSPDGRFIEADASQTFVYDLTGRAVACLTGQGSHADGWLPDSSAVVIRVATAGGRDLTGPTELALLGMDSRITRLGVPGPAYASGGLVYWTSDARWLALADGTGLKIASRDGKTVVTVDAYGGRKFTGHVESIAAATGARFSLLPPENATGNYVKVVQRVPVKIVLDPGQDADHVLRPGLSAEPTVYTK